MLTLDNVVNDEMYLDTEKISITTLNTIVYFSTSHIHCQHECFLYNQHFQ